MPPFFLYKYNIYLIDSMIILDRALSVKVIHTLSGGSIYYSIILNEEVSDLWAVSGWDFLSDAVDAITGATGGGVTAAAGFAITAVITVAITAIITVQGAADGAIIAAGEIIAADR